SVLKDSTSKRFLLNSRMGRLVGNDEPFFCTIWLGKNAYAFWFLPSGSRLHADRAPGGDRHHRDSGRSAASGVVAGERERQADKLPEQPPTNGYLTVLVRR